MESKHYKSGQTLFAANDKGEEMFVVRAGRVRVSMRLNNEDIELSVLGKGESVGEMSLFLGAPRSADVVALEDTEVVVLTRESLLEEFARNPKFAYGLCKEMMTRIASAHQVIGELAGTKKAYELMHGKLG